MEYFHLVIFVIIRVYLIKKYGSQTQTFIFLFHRFFDTVLRTVHSRKKSARADYSFDIKLQHSELNTKVLSVERLYHNLL